MNWKNKESNFFINGLARTLDIGNTYNKTNLKYNSFIADKRSVNSDWKNIGKDLKNAAKVVNE